MRHRSLKRELEQLRGELAERERQLERSPADLQQLRRRLAEEARNGSADTRGRASLAGLRPGRGAGAACGSRGRA
jgi:chromosome segregation ATPase